MRVVLESLESHSFDSIKYKTVSVLSSVFAEKNQLEKEKIKILKYSPEYQVVFSLLVGNPADGPLNWDIQPVVDDYFVPMISKLSNLTSFSISSQIQYYSTLPLSPPKTNIGGKEVFKLYPKDLTHFINSAEWNLASAVSSNPPIHFIVYVPPKQSSPLQIFHSDGSVLESNAFLIPQFGGILIRNPSAQITAGDLQSIMELFAQQLRQLLGVSPISTAKLLKIMNGFKIVIDKPTYGITDWELDRLIRNRINQNVINAVSTLYSLSNLLSSMSNMAVLSHITELVTSSLNSVDKVSKMVASGDFNSASLQAKSAISNAEKAFFDPTMVSLLYFPIEHMLAIYTPFFLPIAMPLISALVKELKILKNARLKKVKTD
ncbi:GPI transamidase component [Terramyces sp. JEL0728]|nr:GPI transamidase component [Terramyces sp. JEL0728]